MSLPLPAIDRIFDRLATAYGRQFTDLYAGVDPASVKTTWSYELAAFASNAGLRRIAWALDNLPERPPNVIAFRNLCRQAPAPEAPALPTPPANPARMHAELQKLGWYAPKDQRMTAGQVDHKAWAKRILARHEAGEKLNPTTLRFAREAMGVRA